MRRWLSAYAAGTKPNQRTQMRASDQSAVRRLPPLGVEPNEPTGGYWAPSWSERCIPTPTKL